MCAGSSRRVGFPSGLEEWSDPRGRGSGQCLSGRQGQELGQTLHGISEDHELARLVGRAPNAQLGGCVTVVPSCQGSIGMQWLFRNSL